MKLTKDDIIEKVRASGCDMLTSLPLESMTRESVIAHLRDCKCPTLRTLKSQL